MAAWLSLVISALALTLAVFLPAWERYTWPKVVLRQVDDQSIETFWCVRIINRRRDPLRVNRAWIMFEDGVRHPTWATKTEGHGDIAARSARDFFIGTDIARYLLFNVHVEKHESMVAFCQEGVGHVWRSRPFDISDASQPTPFAGWRRIGSALLW